MGILQILLWSYHHLRGVAAVSASASRAASHLSSPVLISTLSTATACSPSSLTLDVRVPASRADERTRLLRCLPQLSPGGHWKRRKRRRSERGISVDEIRNGDVAGCRRCSGAGVYWLPCTAVALSRACEGKLEASQAPESTTHVSGSIRTVPFPKQIPTSRLRLCHEDLQRNAVSATALSIRRYHTNSAGDGLMTSSTCSSTTEAEGGAPSLLGDILRRLDDVAVDTESCPVPPAEVTMDSTPASPHGREKKAAYVPLLFRSDFMRSAALRGHHHPSVPLHTGTAPVVSAVRIAPARPELASPAASLSATATQQPPVPLSSAASAPSPHWMPTTAREAPSEDECPDEKAAPQPERVGRQHHTTAATITKARNDDDDSAEAPRTSAHDADTVCTREGDAAVATAATAVTSSAEMDGQDTHDERQADGLDEDDVVVDANMNCSGAPQPASSATSRHRRSHKLILDPVEWLAQAADAPLMDLEALYSSTAVTDTMAYASSVSYADEGAAAVAHEHNEDGISFSTGDVTPPTTDGTMTVDARPPPETAVVHRYLAPTREGEEQEAELLADLLRDVPPQRQKQRRRQQPGPAHNPSYTQAESTESANTTAAPLPASLQAATDKPALESDALVYNVFTRRIAKASSSTIRMLALMGIGVQPETRELTVTDPEALQSLASELRAHRVSWPKLWSRGPLYRQLESLLSDEHVADAAERVAGLLRLQYNKSHLQRQRPGLVVGDGSPTGGGISSLSSTSADAAPAMAESVDDKLLTVQDLNEEQQAVVELIMQGHHTYIGGGAGTGKSVLLRVIKQRLVQEGLAVAVTGTTGIAGTQIGGCTLHHCLGINVSGEFTRRKDLSSYDVIIIDEVSMLSLELFESLEVHLRRANNVHLPFGGVQMILCGDFLQLGAIDSRPLITSQLFRRYFVHLKLETVVRQNKDLRFAAQLQQLRRGRVPADLSETVRFVSPQQIQAAQQAEVELKRRQHAQLARLAPQGENGGEGRTTNGTDTTSGDGGQDERQSGDGISGGNTNCVSESTTANGGTRAAAAPMVPFVNGAVNLLPTNREVNLTNAQQLQQLPGEPVTYAPQFLPPCLVGCWSPTFILRVCEPEKLHMKTLRLEIQRYLGNFYTMGQRASPASQPPVTASAVGFSDGEWLLNPHLGERSVVLYPLFVDALVFRVRLPLTMDREEVRQFLMHVAELDRHLATLQVGVRIRDVLAHGEGMHTEQDEYILSQYAARAPLAHSLTLKVGARVMLRTNFAPGLVNGSLGTVVGFRKLVLEELPRYLVGNAQREESIVQYSDFLQYEQGFQAPIVPVVDFNGRQVPIPPMTQYVGGMPNTHHYSMGIVALPLSLAYAFTVHKVQGLTLVGRVHLELSRMWPCEHLLYVAMSRVRNPEQLSVSSFHQHLVRAAADCLLFDDSLPPVWSATIAPYMLAATWKRSPSRRKKVLLKKQLEAYVKQRRSKLMDDARKGDIRAEIRLLEEKMLQQRARAAARAKERTLKKNGS